MDKVVDLFTKEPFTRPTQEDVVIVQRRDWDVLIENSKHYKILFEEINKALVCLESRIIELENKPRWGWW